MDDLEAEGCLLSDLYFDSTCGPFTLLQAAINVHINRNNLNVVKMVMAELHKSGPETIYRALEEDIYRENGYAIVSLQEWMDEESLEASGSEKKLWIEIYDFLNRFYEAYPKEQ